MYNIRLSKLQKIIIISISLVFVFLLSCYYGSHKLYLYQDEVLSYTLANRQGGGFIKLEDGSYSGAEIFSNLTVNDENRFDYKNVSYNQSLDAHPILYYDILHTICSFFYGTYSNWYGISINIVCLIGIIVFLYLITSELFPTSDIIPLLVAISYGFSVAAMTMVCFIRMYALLTMICEINLYIHIKQIQNKNRLFPLTFILTMITGLLTNFYFLVFAFFVSAFYCILQLYKKSIKDIIIYIVSTITSFVTVLFIYPHYINTLLGYETSPIAQNSDFVLGSISERFRQMVLFANVELFGGKLKYIILILFLYIVYLFISRKIKIKDILKISPIVIMTLFTSILYFIVITLVTPYLCDRYVWPAFPMFFMVVSASMVYLFEDLFKSRLIALIMLLLLAITPIKEDVRQGLTDNNMIARISSAAENHNLECFFIRDIPIEENVFELKEYDKVTYCSSYNDLDVDSEHVKSFVVYVPTASDVQDVMDIFIKKGYSSYDRLYVASYASAFVVY